MAKYDKTKFFFLQLKEDFFEEETIKWLEEQKNGKEYVLVYLKLCLKSLKNDGILIRKVGEMYFPYTLDKIAEITNTNVDTAAVAIAALEKVGLIKRFDDGKILVSNISAMIGEQSRGAFKKQQYLASKNSSQIGGVEKKVENFPPEYRIKDIELNMCVNARTPARTRVREENQEILCQRNKKFKDDTCKDCWYYSECSMKRQNEPEWLEEHLKETKEKINEKKDSKESLKELEDFFDSLE